MFLENTIVTWSAHPAARGLGPIACTRPPHSGLRTFVAVVLIHELQIRSRRIIRPVLLALIVAVCVPETEAEAQSADDIQIVFAGWTPGGDPTWRIFAAHYRELAGIASPQECPNFRLDDFFSIPAVSWSLAPHFVVIVDCHGRRSQWVIRGLSEEPVRFFTAGEPLGWAKDKPKPPSPPTPPERPPGSPAGPAGTPGSNPPR
jgi:hypothetical protein